MSAIWFIVFISFSLGTILSYYHLWIYTVLIAVSMVFLSIWQHQYRRDIFFCMIAIAIGILYFQYRIFPEQLVLPDISNAVINGKIISYPRYSPDKCSFLLETDEPQEHMKYVQVYCSFEIPLNRGDRVAVKGELNPPGQAGNPGEFDYAAYLAKKRVFYLLSPSDNDDIVVTTPCGDINRWINSYRDQTQEVIDSFLPKEESAVLQGMLLGKKEGIDEDRYEEYQRIGIVHIFAVSGLHVGFLVLFAYFIASILKLSKRSRFFMTVTLLLVYGTMVGWPVSVQRAGLMSFLALLAHYQGREGNLANSLGLAGVVILLIEPYALFSMSFQLSFMAAWGLVYLYPLLKEYLKYEKKIWDILLVPVCAQAAVIPLVAYYFNLFTPAGLISNIIITYLVGFIVIMGFIALLFISWPMLASLFIYPAGFVIKILNYLAGLIACIPGGSIWVKTPDIFSLIIYFAGLLLLIMGIGYMRNVRYIISGTGLMMIGLIIICLPASVYNRGTLEVVILDVGQGDSILIKTPNGKFILLDGGGSFYCPVGERKVIPYLRHRGIREVYMLINSHPDMDHLQGLVQVAEEISYKYAALPGALFDAEEYNDFKKISSDNHVPILALEKGLRINIERGLDILVLYPDGEKRNTDYNDQSLVLQCEYQDFSMILTGDLENTGLAHLVSMADLERTLVVKVPHHGSKGSLSEPFYDEIKPGIAIISVGEKNIFGHPHQEVLDFLQEREISVLRTDENGAITLSSDGKSMRIECFRE